MLLNVIASSRRRAKSYRDEVIADNPVAYWRLGETSGTTLVEDGGNYSGSYTGSPTLNSAGAVAGNAAAAFNGSSQYAEVAYSENLNPSVFSVEAWAYPTGGAGNFRAVLSSRNVQSGPLILSGFIIYASDSNKWQFWLGAGSAWSRPDGPSVSLNEWVHLVGTFDGTAQRLYVNGVLQATATPSFITNAARPLRIAAGLNEGSPDFYFPGSIDEVAIYNTALSAARIAAHYDARNTA
jgi:hypothetical protein